MRENKRNNVVFVVENVRGEENVDCVDDDEGDDDVHRSRPKYGP